MLDKIDPEVRDLLELLDSLTEDQLATAHLLLAHYVQLYFVDASKKQKKSLLFPYLYKVSNFLRENRKWDYSELAFYHATVLNLAFANIFNEIFSNASPRRTTYNGYTLLQIIKDMLRDYDKVFSDKRSREIFADISFAQKQIYSRIASNLIMHSLYEYETNHGYGLEEQRKTKIKRLLDLYAENWNSKREYYQNLAPQRLLVFHGVSTLLSRLTLDEKQYQRCRTHTGKSIKRYQVSEGRIIKKVSVEYIMTTAYPKLQEVLLEAIDKGYDEEDESAHRYEWFILGNDLLLKDIENMPLEEAHQLLMEVERDKHDVFTSAQFEELAQKYLKTGKDEFERLSAEIGIDKAETSCETSNIPSNTSSMEDREEEEEEEKSAKETSFYDYNITVDRKQLETRLKKSSRTMKKMDIEHSLMFHAVTLSLLVLKDLPKERYKSYKRAVAKAVEMYKETFMTGCRQRE